jgi:predicted oxidoreductase (fatty acid repression mutant protein)
VRPAISYNSETDRLVIVIGNRERLHDFVCNIVASRIRALQKKLLKS